MRLRIDLAYDGSRFHGWAAQTGLRTVQGELETWIPRVLRIPSVPVVCAGRTDAGVHARGQVAHVDLPARIDPSTFERRLRAAVPDDITIWRVSVAPKGFDARFSALWRRYVYRLSDQPVDPLLRHMVTFVRRPLDLDRVNDAAQSLLGLRDFVAFSRAREGATTIRTLQELHASRAAGVIELTVRADAFCHQMVRALTGALVEVGSGRRDAAWLTGLLNATKRSGDVPVMPASGLVLEEVGYPDDAGLAARARESRAFRTLPGDASASSSTDAPCRRTDVDDILHRALSSTDSTVPAPRSTNPNGPAPLSGDAPTPAPDPIPREARP